MERLVSGSAVEQKDNVIKSTVFQKRRDRLHGSAALTVPSNLGEMISGSQIRLARTIAISNGVDADTVADDLFGYDLAELSRCAAEKLIDYLQLLDEQYDSAALRLAG